MPEKATEKGDAAKREEAVLALWREKEIFEKTLQKKAPRGDFVFYDGPPFATGLPHQGSLLSSIIKDVVPRYKTMRGYRVRRRWGWDCHGLPIESLIEKRLNLKTKKDIEKIGVAAFNEAARASVLEFEREWERYIERVGRWVDFKHSYKTMDNSYIESVWWALKQLHEKGLLYEGRKVLLYCPHCETPLAKAEIAMDNTYKDITEEAVTARFRVKNPAGHDLPEGTSLLAWTTTPWTLPGNVALAIGSGIEYGLFTRAGEHVVAALARAPEGWEKVRNISASSLEGIEYEPLFDVPALRSDTSYRVYTADFVTTDEGTGIVHTAVMYGEDDFALGERLGLPMVQLLDAGANFNDLAPESIRGMYIKAAEKGIKTDLEARGLLFEKKNHTHSYPHCYRCGTPLIYNAVASWFIRIQGLKDKLLKENERINWIPAHLKEGRFKHTLEFAPDWTISRNRFWASPLPIWKAKDDGASEKLLVIGSLEELKRRAKKSGNRYFLLRHGEAETNLKDIISCDPAAPYGLSEKGKADVRKALEGLKGVHIDAIYASPFRRTKESAQLAAEVLGFEPGRIVEDARLGEVHYGEKDGISRPQWRAEFPERVERFSSGPKGGETNDDVRRRVGDFLYELDRKERGKNILIVSHGTPLWLLQAAMHGYTKEEAIAARESEYPQPGEVREALFAPLPVNKDYELDLHRPYADSIVLVDDEGREYERIPEVVDCWVESGSMPFAELHYPFEDKGDFERRFPADFIAEYIAQTRTWFYYMHVMGVLLFGKRAFKNVVTTGTILAADGSKMSKSKGNYTDPLAIMDTYGADALRFYMIGSVVMQAEDLNFKDEDVREAGGRVVGLFWNSYKFFELYKEDLAGDVRADESSHVLDRWMRARLAQAVRETTDALDAYDMPRTCRVLKALIDEYSTWYLRRSRDRVRETETRDAQLALANQRYALLVMAQLAAPIMPFIAESVYQGAIGSRESVHLSVWPEMRTRGLLERLFRRESDDERVLKAMAEARGWVSAALRQRADAGVKVRQILPKLAIRSSAPPPLFEEIRSIIAEEVNVQEVVWERGADEILLDTTLTDALREEGSIRELIRLVQAARRKAGLQPRDEAALVLDTSDEARSVISRYEERLKRATTMSAITFASGEGARERVGDFELSIEVKKR